MMALGFIALLAMGLLTAGDRTTGNVEADHETLVETGFKISETARRLKCTVARFSEA